MVLANLQDKRIILASASPRRQELLKGIGIEFEVIVKDNVDEDFSSGIPTSKLALFLARKKASAYFDLINDSTIIITADTIVATENEILNKPADSGEAFKMLTSLSGNKHHVITGVCIMSGYKESCFSEITSVYFNKLDSDEIEFYIKTFEPFDKAGSYGIQEWIGFTGIRRIEGSYFNVMGFPIDRVYNELKKF